MDTNINAGGAFDLSMTPAAPAQTQAQIVPVDDDTNFIVDLTSATRAYCSMVATTPEEQADLYTAMNAPDKKVSECIGDVIDLKDVYVEKVNCTNEETGEIFTQEDGGGEHFYGDKGTTLVFEELYYREYGQGGEADD